MILKSYDVVLLPEEAIETHALQVSSSLKERGVYFTLDNENFYTHLSLYMLQLSDAGLPLALERLSMLAGSTNPISLTSSAYHYENEYLDIEYIKTSELTDLQESILSELNSVREGMREKDQARLINSTGDELENLLQFGYRSIGNQFFPHLTFTRFTIAQKDMFDALPDKEVFDGRYSTLALFEMGDHGTCVRLIKKWSLGVSK